MDLAALQSLIQRSTLLTNEERAYWLQTLPSMAPDQAVKLEAILTANENIHVEEKVQNYFTVANQAKAAASLPPLAA